MAEKNELESRGSKVRATSKGPKASENCDSNCEMKGKVNEMFRRIIGREGVNYKSQQRSETDLTPVEKTGILKDLYEENPALFLSRFGKWLSEEDLECFTESISGSYEMGYAIKKLKKYLGDRNSGTGVKNRRYEAVVRLERDSDYFSEYEMRQRCPLLYEEYIGRYMSDEEKLKRDELNVSAEVTMSSFIFQRIDRDWLEERKELERENEEKCMEEEEEEEENEKIEGNTPSEITDISEEEKLSLRQEFLIVMKQQFLEGRDKDFDYTKVDTSEEFDNMELFSQDEEDKYFDEEEPESCGENENISENISDDDDYLSDKILQKCCTSTR